MTQLVGMIAAVVLPLWNIPLIIRIGRRRSSDDISLAWVIGVELCLLLMLPSAMASSDAVFKAFSFVNSVLFSAVFVQVIRYRLRRR